MSNKFSKKRKTRAIKSKNHKKTSKAYVRNIKTQRNIKTAKNIKGGFLFDQKLNIGGIDLSKETGKKRYNWKTGKWDSYVCYGVGPLKGCKIVPAE